MNPGGGRRDRRATSSGGRGALANPAVRGGLLIGLAIVIGIVLLINAVLGFVQENRADDALAALKQMLELIVRVRRDGVATEVPAGDLVPGDLLLLSGKDLHVNQSALTGEAMPVAVEQGSELAAGM